MNKVASIVLAFLLLVLAGTYISSRVSNHATNNTDAHGCIATDGYSFGADIGACIREADMTPDIKEAAKTAVTYVGSRYGLAVVSFNSYEEPGAYDIVLARPGEATTTVYLRNGNTSTSMPSTP